MPNTLPLPKLLTTAEAAEALAIGRTKLWELTNRGEIPCVRIGKATRYDPIDLRRWIDRHKTKPTKKAHHDE